MPDHTSAPPRLTKSRFVAGNQCPKQLWWKVHDAGAEELKPDTVLQDRFDQGRHVGQLARQRFPGGALIPPGDDAARVATTKEALASSAPAIYEAAFLLEGMFVVADILLREAEGWTLIEVKSSTSQKDEHIPDAAVQVYVARHRDINVRRVEIMHLNPEFRHPDTGDLFVRTDVTAEVEKFMTSVPFLAARFQIALVGPLPDVDIGLHCFEPRKCPFERRCWPDDPWHISQLYNTGPKRTASFLGQGVKSIRDLPRDKKLPDAARRQLLALERNEMIVESGLGPALGTALGDARLGYLDFETINRAVPVWNGLGPWRAAVVQFSYHEEGVASRGQGEGHAHIAYLAEGPYDPQPEMAERLLEATKNAERILMYSSYERTQINQLAERVPACAGDLKALAGKMVDLLPLVRDHVYHPGFRGSFSLKYILTPLVPDLTYRDLAIVDGQTASVEIARLLFVAHLVEDRDQLRRDLLAYCERDTWAMVRLVQRLRELAGI